MAKETDYLKNAAETMQLAQRMSSTSDRGRLLRLAEAWMELADRARSVTRRLRKPDNVHPLIQEKLDSHLNG